MISNLGKTALITGVRNDRSIAWAIAQRLAESGCEVALTYTSENKNEVLGLMEDHGMDPRLSGEVDIRKEEQIVAMFERLADRWDKMDFLLHGTAFGNHNVLCTSPIGSDQPPSGYLDIAFDDLVDSFDISAYSLIRLCRAALPYFSANASVVTLSYQAANKVMASYAGMAISKAALENMTLYLAHALGERGVRVNAISPGLVMSTSAAAIPGVRKLRKMGSNSAPLGNIRSSHVADAALWYFSDLSTKVTGNIHYVDGGLNIVGEL